MSVIPIHFCRFQFHDGTIKSGFAMSRHPWSWLFQFHDGTIKSYISGIPTYRIMNFNSTMVRLKENEAQNHFSQLQYFNSTMVRLKVSPIIFKLSFVFWYFNSTMVRLKGNNHMDWFEVILFQFHDGTIKSSDINVRQEFYCHFNSTMVRLKVNL